MTFGQPSRIQYEKRLSSLQMVLWPSLRARRRIKNLGVYWAESHGRLISGLAQLTEAMHNSVVKDVRYTSHLLEDNAET